MQISPNIAATHRETRGLEMVESDKGARLRLQSEWSPRGIVARLVICSTLLVLFAGLAQAEQPTKPGERSRVEVGEHTTHDSACSLARSIAGKLGAKGRLAHDTAQRQCSALAPGMMNTSEKAEFVRCCTERLEKGPPAADGAPAQEPKKRPASKGARI